MKRTLLSALALLLATATLAPAAVQAKESQTQALGEEVSLVEFVRQNRHARNKN